MLDLSLVRYGFCFLVSCALWPVAMVGYWAFRLWPDMPSLTQRDFVAFAAHALGLLAWLVTFLLFVIPRLQT